MNRLIQIIMIYLLFSSCVPFKKYVISKENIPENSSPNSTEACNKVVNLSSVDKPKGVFSSVLTSSAIQNSTAVGGLIRVSWANLETSPGIFDWSIIDDKIAFLPLGKKWSLAIHGGWSSVDAADPQLYNGETYPNGTLKPTIDLNMSPSWLEDTYSVSTFEMEFRQVTVNMPKYWDTTVQTRLQSMIEAVADRYKSNSDLMLVYVPQMTSNGIEGHFNGVPDNTLITAAGINTSDLDAADQFETIWVNAAVAVSKIIANAFDNKAIAFEVHEVIGRATIPEKIMNTFLTDSSFENRVGIAMWWIDGDDSSSAYQKELIELIRDYEGDLYGQVIGNSSQDCGGGGNSCVDSSGKTWTGGGRFPGGYDSVFSLAKDLCMRYIEPWNYEFENNTKDSLMTDFNNFAEDSF